MRKSETSAHPAPGMGQSAAEYIRHATSMMEKLTRMPLATTVVFLAATSPAGAESYLAFGIYASDKPSIMVRKFRPTLNALQEELSRLTGKPMRIRMQIAKSYEQGVIDLVAGKVDFARFGPASYLRARDADPRVEILAIENKQGRSPFGGVIAVASDSPIQAVAELRGKSFAFGDERSTIGRYLPQLHLMRNNIRAPDLKVFEYLGRHDAVGAAIASGMFDAGALQESTFKRLVRKNVKLRAIARLRYVAKPWIARGGLPANTRKLLRRALRTLDARGALKTLGSDGLLDGSAGDFAGIRKAILVNHLFFRKAGTETAERK